MIFTNNLNISSHELLYIEKPVGVALQFLAQYVKRYAIPCLKRLLWYIAIKIHESLPGIPITVYSNDRASETFALFIKNEPLGHS